MKCPGNNLEKILPLTGLQKKGKKDKKKKTRKESLLIEYIGNETCIKVSGIEIYNIQDMVEVERQLREHIPECLGCFFGYHNFLNKKRRNQTIRKTDKEYLNIFS